MQLNKYLEQEAIALDSYEDAMVICKILVENGHCVMISREENLWMVNWVWTPRSANRNDVIFIERSSYECDYWNWLQAQSDNEEDD